MASNICVRLKDNVTLTCDTSNVTSTDDIDVFHWYNNDTLVSNVTHQTFSFSVETEEDGTEYSCAAGGEFGFTNRSQPVRITILNDPGKSLKFDKGLRGLGSFRMKYSVVNGKLNYNGKRI